MSAEHAKILMEKRAELEKQLQSLTGRGDVLYTPGMTMISGDGAPLDEQTALQIEVSRSSPFAPQMKERLSSPY